MKGVLKFFSCFRVTYYKLYITEKFQFKYVYQEHKNIFEIVNSIFRVGRR